MDIICLSETYFDSSIHSDIDNLEILGYNFVRSDHPSNNKRGRDCIKYKVSLPLRVIICFLQECTTFEVMLVDKQCNFNVTMYRSTSQNQDELFLFQKILK